MRPCIVPLIGRETCMTLFYILGTGEVRDSWSFYPKEIILYE